jgi:lysophospholipase L1-like esterase
MTTICVFGDSITYGESDYKIGGWVNQLRLFFNNNFEEDISVYNLGISGDNSSDLLSRFDQEAKIRKPDFVLFAIGINDIPHGKKVVEISKSQENFLKLIEISKSRGYNIAFVGLTPVDEKILKSYRKMADVLKYNQLIQQICNKQGIDFIPILEFISLTDLADGLHLNFNSHKKIFEKVKKYFIEKLKKEIIERN